jgi:hypothetical protein
MIHFARVWKVRVRPKMYNSFYMDIYIYIYNRIMFLNRNCKHLQTKHRDMFKIGALIKITKPSLAIKPGACIIILITAVTYRFPY